MIVTDHLSGQIKANLDELREIQLRLAGRSVGRTTTRILDALLWITHPASELWPLAEVIARWREEDGD